MNEANQEQTDLLSSLPAELFIDHIFPYLDVFSLISLGSTCTYLQGIANALLPWSSRIQKKFGYLPDDSEVANGYDGSYRRYFIEKGCLRFDGVYVSRCVYYRRVRPIGNIHLTEDEKRSKRNASATLVSVCYFRYLMFIPNSDRCLCMRSEAPMQEAIKVLKRCNSVLQRQQQSSQEDFTPISLAEHCGGLTSDELRRLHQVVVAEWSFQELRSKMNHSLDNAGPQGLVRLRYFEPSNFNPTRYLNEARLALSHHVSFDNESQIYFKRYNSVLNWRSFAITTEAYDGRPEHRDDLSLADSSHFRPFTFARIRSMANYF